MNPSTLLTDCHIHSTHSLDGHDTIKAICRQAIRRGLGGVCFTEHLYLEPEDDSYGFFDYDRYMADLEAARRKYGDRLLIWSGIEISYQPHLEAEITAFLEGKDFDLVMGSVHYVDGDFVFSRVFDNRSEAEAYGRYFEIVHQAVQSGLFDVLGHLDIVKRHGVRYYGPFLYKRYAGQIDTILKALIATDTALEVNASGLRHAPKEPYPGLEVLRRYRELGGELLTVGSDAHRASDVGRGIGEVIELLDQAGFKTIPALSTVEGRTFKARQAIQS